MVREELFAGYATRTAAQMSGAATGLVMVGEQVQEMQMAGWLPTTELPLLAHLLPGWMGLWFSTFPNVQGLVAQCLAAALVFGSYFIAQKPKEAAPQHAATLRDIGFDISN